MQIACKKNKVLVKFVTSNQEQINLVLRVGLEPSGFLSTSLTSWKLCLHINPFTEPTVKKEETVICLI